jgi:DNA helicase II / ATP-dependent DNA helicase PcrA
VREQYRHLTVDEYQDVNPLQQRLLDLWLGEGDDICVVGDPAQTIYTFTGASPRFLEEFATRHRHARTITLDRCYRCTPEVVALANHVVPRGRGRIRVRLVSQRSRGPRPAITVHADEVAEAQATAEHIRRLVSTGVAPRDIAVLYRINAQSEVFEDALTHEDIPYTVRGGDRFFERAEVRQALVLLRGARAGGHSGDIHAPTLVDQVRAALSPMNMGAEAPASRGAAREKWESLAALMSLAEDLVAVDPKADLDALITDLEARAAAQHAPSLDGVTLSTFHAAKGLEWRHVFVVGLVEGTVPITYAATADAIEEERRLLYVAVTRAADGLTLSWSRARTPGQRPSRTRSRFMAGIDSGVLEISGDPTFEQ